MAATFMPVHDWDMNFALEPVHSRPKIRRLLESKIFAHRWSISLPESINPFRVTAENFSNPISHIINRHGIVVRLTVLGSSFGEGEYLQPSIRAIYRGIDRFLGLP
jgi:hypothetical protein